LAKGDLVEEVNRRKNESGKDIIVYGGANFVSSLIKENLIDEYNFFVNPAAIGKVMTIFEGKLNLTLVKSQAFDYGVVMQCYEPK
jgi:dihydrofolate reductase